MAEKLPLAPTDNWPEGYWIYNLPLQMWPSEEGWRVLNYMPRKERCQHLEELVTPAELPAFCKNAAVVLRNLADLFEALGEGKIKTIYYPDQTVAEAMKDDDDDDSLQPGESDLNSGDAHNQEGEQDDPVGNEGEGHPHGP